MHTRLAFVSALFTLATLVATGTPAYAQETVLFEVRGRDTVKGTLRPAYEREGILCDVVEGTVIKATVKSAQKTGPIPTLELLRGDTLVPDAVVTPKGRGAVLAPYTVGATGLYKVVVFGDGALDGDYELAVSWTARKRFSDDQTADTTATFPFSAPAGAKVTIAAKAAPGSAYVPRLTTLTDPAGGETALPPGSRFAFTTLVRGDYAVSFENDGGPGRYLVSATIAVSKPKKGKFDVRDAALAGAFSGGPVVFGAVVDPLTGETILVANTGTPLDGSSITVPAGALGQPTALFIAQGMPLELADGIHTAGPAVEFSPSGLTFPPGLEAQITIPYDPSAFPNGTQDLVVYVRHGDGTIESIVPSSIGANTVTFFTSSFSTFQATTTGDRPLPGGEFILLRVRGYPAESLAGSVGVELGTATFGGQGFEYFGDVETMRFDPGEAGTSPPSVTRETEPAQLFTPSRVIDDRTIELPQGSTPDIGPLLRRGLRDDVLVAEHDPQASQFILGPAVLLRRTVGDATLNSIAGKWHVLVWEFRADLAVAGTLPLLAITQTGTAVVSTSGAVSFDYDDAEERTTRYPGGVWTSARRDGGKVAGTIDRGVEGPLRLRFGGRERVVDLLPALGGEVMLARLADFDRGTGTFEQQVGVMLFVREAATAAIADTVGSHFSTAGGVETDEAVPADEGLGLHFAVASGSDTRSPKRTFKRSGPLSRSGYDALGEPALDFRSESFSAQYAVAKNGAFTATPAGIRGALLPSGGFTVYVEGGLRRAFLGFATQFSRIPPIDDRLVIGEGK